MQFKELSEHVVRRTLYRAHWGDPGAVNGSLDLYGLRGSLVQDDGGFDRTTRRMLADGSLDPERISIKAIRTALGDSRVHSLGPVPVTQLGTESISGHDRAVTTSGFVVLMGNVLTAQVERALQRWPSIGQKLVTSYSATAGDDIVGRIADSDSDMKPVAEAGDYPEVDVLDESYTISAHKFGRILKLTNETIRRDEMLKVLRWADQLGEMMARFKERLTLNRVCDTNLNSVRVYNPNGTATALYSTSARVHGTNQVNSNALVDMIDIEAARAELAGMTDEASVPIVARSAVMLVPDALVLVAQGILNGIVLPNPSGAEQSWGRHGEFRPELLSSPILDKFTNGTTDWFLGDPARQFLLRESIALDTAFTTGEPDGFAADIDSQFKVRWAGDVGADGYEYFVKSQSAA